MNYLWGFMILIGIIYAIFTGNISLITDGALESAKDAIALCITMLGVMSFWTGMMNIADKAGIIAAATRFISPFVHFMFPHIPREDESLTHISTNIIANVMGMGWAATPAGIKAMKCLARLNEDRGGNVEIATNEMCTFLVINISSLQLIPVNMIAYRSQYGSINPTAVIGPGLVATIFSTLIGVIFCKIVSKKDNIYEKNIQKG